MKISENNLGFIISNNPQLLDSSTGISTHYLGVSDFYSQAQNTALKFAVAADTDMGAMNTLLPIVITGAASCFIPGSPLALGIGSVVASKLLIGAYNYQSVTQASWTSVGNSLAHLSLEIGGAALGLSLGRSLAPVLSRSVENMLGNRVGTWIGTELGNTLGFHISQAVQTGVRISQEQGVAAGKKAVLDQVFDPTAIARSFAMNIVSGGAQRIFDARFSNVQFSNSNQKQIVTWVLGNTVGSVTTQLGEIGLHLSGVVTSAEIAEGLKNGNIFKVIGNQITNDLRSAAIVGGVGHGHEVMMQYESYQKVISSLNRPPVIAGVIAAAIAHLTGHHELGFASIVGSVGTCPTREETIAELCKIRNRTTTDEVVDLRGHDLRRHDLKGITNWENVELNFKEINDNNGLQGTQLDGAACAFLRNNQVTNFRQTNLRGANLRGANLQGTNFQEANLEEAAFYLSNLQGANFHGANLEGTHLNNTNLQDADLQGADLKRAYLDWADLQGADLKRADLKRAYLLGGNLLGANLQGADLSFAILNGANLQQADLTEASLLRAQLKNVNLTDANLSSTDLTHVKFESTILTGSIFYHAIVDPLNLPPWEDALVLSAVTEDGTRIQNIPDTNWKTVDIHSIWNIIDNFMPEEVTQLCKETVEKLRASDSEKQINKRVPAYLALCLQTSYFWSHDKTYTARNNYLRALHQKINSLGVKKFEPFYLITKLPLKRILNFFASDMLQYAENPGEQEKWFNNISDHKIKFIKGRVFDVAIKSGDFKESVLVMDALSIHEKKTLFREQISQSTLRNEHLTLARIIYDSLPSGERKFDEPHTQKLGDYFAAQGPAISQVWKQYIESGYQMAIVTKIVKESQEILYGKTSVDPDNEDRLMAAFVAMGNPSTDQSLFWNDVKPWSYDLFKQQMQTVRSVPKAYLKGTYSFEVDEVSAHRTGGVDSGKVKELTDKVVQVGTIKNCIGWLMGEIKKGPLKTNLRDKLCTHFGLEKTTDFTQPRTKTTLQEIWNEKGIGFLQDYAQTLAAEVAKTSGQSKTNLESHEAQVHLARVCLTNDMSNDIKKLTEFDPSSSNAADAVQALHNIVIDQANELRITAPSFNTLRQTVATIESAMTRAKTGKKAKVEIVFSKNPMDQFFGYIGEDCTKNRMDEIKKPNFMVGRVIVNGHLEGMLYLNRSNVKPTTITTAFGLRRRIGYVDMDQLVMGIADTLKQVSSDNKGIRFVMPNNANQAGNLGSMWSAVERAGFTPVTIDGLNQDSNLFKGNIFLQLVAA